MCVWTCVYKKRLEQTFFEIFLSFAPKNAVQTSYTESAVHTSISKELLFHRNCAQISSDELIM